jgi:hypothetical protein
MQAHTPPAQETSLLARYRKDKVFSKTQLFRTYAERLVRKHVMLQFNVQEGHPVLEEEEKLLRESTSEIREYLAKSKVKWSIPWHTAKVVVVQYVRKACAECLKDHELDEDDEEAVLEGIYREDFETLFPSTWVDA